MVTLTFVPKIFKTNIIRCNPHLWTETPIQQNRGDIAVILYQSTEL